jgi:hypothetical protein
MLQPYWIKLRLIPEPTPLNLGVGVTANSELDARSLLSESIGKDHDILEIRVIEDMAMLDQKHVAPNIGNPLLRGIWFPLGYSSK